MKCLICEKELQSVFPEMDNHYRQPNDGGEITINFAYGSQYDQGLGGFNLPDDRAEELCNHTIISYICDDCFKEKANKPDIIEGWDAESYIPKMEKKL